MPHHQQKVNEKRYTTTGITPHRRSLPATDRLPPDGRTGRSFIEQRRLIADSKSGQCSATAGALPATTELTRRESARYALLLAQATDKCEKPLLPCDSLLDVALDYYDDDERERAVALLYKGRLEAEMAQSERTVDFLLGGLEIIKKFPQEIEIRRHLLSSLGNEYYDARLYEKAGKTYKELYECCFTDKDKAIALYSLSQDLLTSNKDSLIALKQ